MTALFASAWTIISLASVLFAAPAAGPESELNSRISVTFVAPEKFTDAKLHATDTESDSKNVLETLQKSMIEQASHYLRKGLKLDLKITDIDLAGDFELWRSPAFNDVRILKSIYPPRMTIEFRLTEGSSVLTEGKRRLSDPNFLRGSLRSPDPLYYDKELYHDWLRREFRNFRE